MFNFLLPLCLSFPNGKLGSLSPARFVRSLPVPCSVGLRVTADVVLETELSHVMKVQTHF